MGREEEQIINSEVSMVFGTWGSPCNGFLLKSCVWKAASCEKLEGCFEPATRQIQTSLTRVVMSTGNPGVSPERPQPVPLNTLTLGAGRGISWVWVQVWRGFEGVRVEWRVTHNFGDTVMYINLIISYILHSQMCEPHANSYLPSIYMLRMEPTPPTYHSLCIRKNTFALEPLRTEQRFSQYLRAPGSSWEYLGVPGYFWETLRHSY